MAEQRGSGDERGRVKHDGPSGAGTGPSGRQRLRGKSVTGQQSGSNRPAVKTGSAKKAPKKADIPPKGIKREGAAKKTGTGKSMAAKRLASKKASRMR